MGPPEPTDTTSCPICGPCRARLPVPLPRSCRLVPTKASRENSRYPPGRAFTSGTSERGAAQMEPRDQLVMLNGLRFHYREWGRPDAPPLVLLHGFGAHSRLWDTFARAAVEDFHIF